jgi:nucleolar protein 56
MDKETINLNKKAITKAAKDIKKTYSPDKMIMQAVQALNEEEQNTNTEYERLREMFWRYYPEHLEKVDDINKLIKTIIKGIKVPEKSMGYNLSNEELEMMKSYAKAINNHLKTQGLLETFIKKQVRKIAPETANIAGPVLTAKLITLAGGLKQLMLMPSSTIQLLGAEKALFRHLKSGAKPPKHGVILFHQEVQAAKNKGRAARKIANKIMKTIRIDYFRGENQ